MRRKKGKNLTAEQATLAKRTEVRWHRVTTTIGMLNTYWCCIGYCYYWFCYCYCCHFFSIQLSTEKRVHYYSFRSHYFVFRHFVILRNNADDSYWSEIRRSPPSARLPCYKMCRPASQWCHHRSNHLFFTMVNTTIYSCSIITTMNIYIYRFTLLYHLEKIVAIYV